MSGVDRPLSDREQQFLLAMIDGADEDDECTSAARSVWRSHLPALRVDGVCGCGTCPSISLVRRPALASNDDGDGVVLGARLDDALVLLFIDGGVPSYLELAPRDDQTVYTEFPDASRHSF